MSGASLRREKLSKVYGLLIPGGSFWLHVPFWSFPRRVVEAKTAVYLAAKIHWELSEP